LGGAPGGGGGVGGANATLSVAGAGHFGGGSGGSLGRSVQGGGFGGGGGAASRASRGGNGGFGGGGGTGFVSGGLGGFGGGSGGGRNEAGGGGGGMGGGVFVHQGGTLILAGSLTINGNSVDGGAGSHNGSAFGSGLFLQGSGTVTFAPGSGESQTVFDVITDQAGSGGTGGNALSYGLVKQGTGTLTLSAANTYTGATTVEAGTLALSGSLKSSTTVTAGATLQGTGRITGALTVAGTIAPGNSIGTFNVTGNYTQNTGSIYTVEVNSAGQSDLINITGAATLNGGTVSVQAAGGTYGRNTTYTILSATGGVSGTYAGVISNFAFLTPSLSYGADSVMLTLVASANSFRDGAQTPNQAAVGAVLDQATPGATGDFANVLTALSTLDTTQGPKALEAIGGQSYSGFSSVMVQGAQLFMDSFQLQAGGGAIGGSAGLPGGSTYMALRTDAADACDAACDVASQWGVWGTGLGAFGTVAGDTNANGLTYNLGGFIGGLDHRFGSNVRAGVATGFNAASLYAQNIPGYGTSNTLQLALYGEYAEGPFYLDALAGYAHSDNRMTRPIVIPGLPFRSAQAYTTANTVVGQLEAGYKLTIAPSFGGFVTPFARLQASTSTQNGFTETGADSLNLTVAAQTTQSLRTVLGTQLGAAIDAPWREKLNLMLRLGWSHEYADLSRPVTASFAGAPTLGFTTFGAVAPRDGVVLGFGGNTAVAERTNVYLRYDGDLAGGNTSHVLSAGIRYVW
jgi:outer membrane autotransporter protein